jgi:hypothetical protein
MRGARLTVAALEVLARAFAVLSISWVCRKSRDEAKGESKIARERNSKIACAGLVAGYHFHQFRSFFPSL